MVRKQRRWQSAEWLKFVRSLPCRCGDPRCPPCSGERQDRIVAAHLRNRTGVGQKPHDFLVYPLSDTIHRIFHDKGQPDVAWQLERVTEVWHIAFDRGLLTFSTSFDLEGLPF